VGVGGGGGGGEGEVDASGWSMVSLFTAGFITR